MLKRSFDVVISLVFLVILSPLCVVIAALIKLDPDGPVLYRATRIGFGGKEVTFFKFRTMVGDADRRGPGVTLLNDSRVTRVGRLLRKFKLDEIPQLVNVVRGEMSLVGPRPEDPRYLVEYPEKDRSRIFSVRPGLTNPAMIHFRHEEVMLAEAGGDQEETYCRVHIPNRLRMDLEYIESQSFWLDLSILARAFISLFTPAGRSSSTRRGAADGGRGGAPK